MPTRCPVCEAELREDAAVREGQGFEIRCGTCGTYWIGELFMAQLPARYPNKMVLLRNALAQLHFAGQPRQSLNSETDVRAVVVAAGLFPARATLRINIDDPAEPGSYDTELQRWSLVQPARGHGLTNDQVVDLILSLPRHADTLWCDPNGFDGLDTPEPIAALLRARGVGLRGPNPCPTCNGTGVGHGDPCPDCQ